jgi:hypothetical protein
MEYITSKNSEKIKAYIANANSVVMACIKEEIKRIQDILLAEDPNNEIDGEIRLETPPMYQYIDDQFSQVVGGIMTDGEIAVIDTGDDEFKESIDSFGLELKIAILEELEKIVDADDIELN